VTSGASTAAAAVFLVTLIAIFGPLLGLSPAWIAVAVALALGALTLDASSFGGRGGHLVAEALPGGQRRLRRIAIHEAGHLLTAAVESIPVRRVLIGTLACQRAGVASGGCTEFEMPGSTCLPAEDLRRWSRVLLAGMVAEETLFGESVGGADDRTLLGVLWGRSGFDAATAQMELRRARREVALALRQRRGDLEQEAERLLATAPRLLRPSPDA
jgi:hypothetical protein